jgi:uncharacterized damage-inducible protein DinB
MEFREIFLKQKEAIHKRMVEILGLVRPEHMEWRPENDALSVGEMLQHLWVSEEGVRRVALQGDFAYYEARIPQGLRATLGPQATLEDNLANLARVYGETMAAVAACPVGVFEEERVRPDLGYRRPVWAILLGINEHEVHHRAQLSTYLRILGTPVPDVAGSYRPTSRRT